MVSTDCTLRLVGEYNWTGRIELFFLNEWRGVCDDKWDRKDATVVCRQLGFPGVINNMSTLSSTSENYWIDEIECDGSEEKICNCSSAEYGVEDCTMQEGAGVTCDSTSNTGNVTMNISFCN